MDLYVNITDLDDAYNANPDYLTWMVRIMEDQLNNGLTIIIEQRYDNAPPELIVALNNHNELNDWLNQRYPNRR